MVRQPQKQERRRRRRQWRADAAAEQERGGAAQFQGGAQRGPAGDRGRRVRRRVLSPWWGSLIDRYASWLRPPIRTRRTSSRLQVQRLPVERRLGRLLAPALAERDLHGRRFCLRRVRRGHAGASRCASGVRSGGRCASGVVQPGMRCASSVLQSGMRCQRRPAGCGAVCSGAQSASLFLK